MLLKCCKERDRQVERVGFLVKIEWGGGLSEEEVGWAGTEAGRVSERLKGKCVSESKLQPSSANSNRVHAKGVILCERTCFCLLSTF